MEGTQPAAPINAAIEDLDKVAGFSGEVCDRVVRVVEEIVGQGSSDKAEETPIADSIMARMYNSRTIINRNLQTILDEIGRL